MKPASSESPKDQAQHLRSSGASSASTSSVFLSYLGIKPHSQAGSPGKHRHRKSREPSNSSAAYGLRAVASTGPVLLQQDGAGSRTVVPLDDVRILVEDDPQGILSPAAVIREEEPKEEDLLPAEPEILPGELATTLDQDALQQLAYTFFCSALHCKRSPEPDWTGGGSPKNPSVASKDEEEDEAALKGRLEEAVAAGLQIGSGMSKPTRALLQEIGALSGNSSRRAKLVCSMRLPLRLLGVGRESHFEGWRAFVRWRDGWVRLVECVTVQQAQWLRDNGASDSSRRHLARLCGGLRRLQVTEQREYHTEEYAESVTFVQEAAAEVADAVAWELHQTAEESNGSETPQKEKRDQQSSNAGPGKTEEGSSGGGGGDKLYPSIFIGTSSPAPAVSAGSSPGGAAVAARVPAGEQLPLEVRLAAAKLLVYCIFDDLELDEVAQAKDELLANLRESVWPMLGVDEEMDAALLAWAYFSRYMYNGSPMLLKDCIAACKSAAWKVRKTEVDREGDVEAGTLLCQSVVATIQGCITHCLGDYLGRFGINQTGPGSAGNKMSGLLHIMEAITPEKADLEPLVAALVQRSVVAEVGRASEGHPGAEDGDPSALLTLAKQASELILVNEEQFVPILERFAPRARQIAAEAVHQALGTKITGFFATEPSLEKRTLLLADYCDRLDSALLKVAEQGSSFELEAVTNSEADPEPEGSWAVMGSLGRALRAWTSANVAKLPTWVQRACENEKWEAPAGHSDKCCDTACSLVRITSDALEHLFDLEVRIPADHLEEITDTINAYVGSFSDAATKPLVWQHFEPPVPHLTRFKDKVVKKSQRRESNPHLSSGFQHSAASDASPGPVVDLLVPPITLPSNRNPSPARSSSSSKANSGRQSALLDVDPAQFTATEMVLRLNSLSFVRQQLPEVLDEVRDRWRPYGTVPNGVDRMAFIERLLDGSTVKLDEAIQTTLDFIAAKLIYADLRQDLFGRLYRWDVRETRMGPVVLDRLDMLLGDIISEVEDPDMVQEVAMQTLQTFVKALLQVLLDGGAPRLFRLDDAALIGDDIWTDLMATFVADNEGLERDVVEAELKPLSEVLDLMKLKTPSLIDLFNSFKVKPSYNHEELAVPPYPQGSSIGLSANGDVVLRVMAHRADHACSKVLKTYYNLPRGDDSSEGWKVQVKSFTAAFKLPGSLSPKSVSGAAASSSQPPDGGPEQKKKSWAAFKGGWSKSTKKKPTGSDPAT